VFSLARQDCPRAAKTALDRWISWARRCRIPAFVDLARRAGKHRNAIHVSRSMSRLWACCSPLPAIGIIGVLSAHLRLLWTYRSLACSRAGVVRFSPIHVRPANAVGRSLTLCAAVRTGAVVDLLSAGAAAAAVRVKRCSGRLEHGQSPDGHNVSMRAVERLADESGVSWQPPA
jgi:hypothetical protein